MKCYTCRTQDLLSLSFDTWLVKGQRNSMAYEINKYLGTHCHKTWMLFNFTCYLDNK
jgi:hypothetical protein